ncbi:UBX domain-containing protein [Dirofilaria immitis]
MEDDYEILDPTKAASTFNHDTPPETPILSSRLESVTPSDPAAADKKNNKEKVKKVVLQKKDAEIQFEHRKESKKKTNDKRHDDSKLFDMEQKQGKSDQFIYVEEYESIASAIRRAFLITTALGFLICIFYSALGVAYLIYNKQFDFNFD